MKTLSVNLLLPEKTCKKLPIIIIICNNSHVALNKIKSESG